MQMMCSLPDLPLASKNPSPTMESANGNQMSSFNSDSEDLNITTMTSSPSSPSIEDTHDSEIIQPKNQRSGCILKFSIEKIMEPDHTTEKNRKVERTKSSRPADVVSSYDSAFKKYVPNSTMQQFVANRHQDFLSQYPLLYYPNQLMCAAAAAQYAALTQHSNTVNLLANNGNTSPSSISTLTTLSNLTIQSYHHHNNQSHSIKRANSPGHEKISVTSSTAKSSRKTMHESHAEKKLISSNNHVQSNTNLPQAITSPSSTTSSSSSTAAAVANAKQKTFSCPDCGKQFNAMYNLTRHMPGKFSALFVELKQILIFLFSFNSSYWSSSIYLQNLW